MFGSLRKRGGTIVVAAIVGAVAAGSPAVAAEVVAFAKSAGNANTVNKIGASKTPRAGMLVPLNASGKFPAAVIPSSRQAVGKAGPAGPAGPQGLQGAPGASGAMDGRTGRDTPPRPGKAATGQRHKRSSRRQRRTRATRASPGPMEPTAQPAPRVTRAIKESSPGRRGLSRISSTWTRFRIRVTRTSGRTSRSTHRRGTTCIARHSRLGTRRAISNGNCRSRPEPGAWRSRTSLPTMRGS